MTAASFAWVWGLLSVAWPPRYLLCVGLAAYLGAATWVTTQTPWPGLVLTAGGLAALGLLGIGTQNPAPLGPLFIVLVTVGYLVAPPWSALAVPVLILSTAGPARWDLASIIFGGLLLVLPWWFGFRVRVRDARRRAAVEDARRLAGVDAAALARQAAAAERDEVAASALGVIGHAVGRMTVHATAARESLEPAVIEAIHRTGEEATQRLRALLVLLRDEPAGPAGTGEPETLDEGALDVEQLLPAPAPEDSGGWRQALTLGGPAALMLLDVVTMPFMLAALREVDDLALPAPEFVLFIVLPLMVAVVIRDRWPEVALLGAALVLVLGSVAGLAQVGRDGLWLIIAAVALSWAAGQAGTRRVLGAWVIFTMTLGYLVFIDTPYYLPIYLAMEALPFGAAAVWAGHHAVETASLDLVHLRQAEIAEAERHAVSRARLHLARDLHDAASHAVGTMMMQANAARVLRERDPGAARTALDAIVDIGQEAAAELQAMCTSPAPGVATAQGPGERSDPGAITEAIAPLVTAARRTGARVSTTVDITAPMASKDVVLLLRIVREGLANAVRHAPGSQVRVQVRVDADHVLARVNNGPARPHPGQDGGVPSVMGLGLGLRGLRELLGERQGELSVAATDGGFELRASFPPHHAERPVASS